MAEKQQQRQPNPKSKMVKRYTGKVTRFVDYKGFGFIKPDDGDENLFVHHSFIKSKGFRTLVEGESVQFTVAVGNNGNNRAIDVISLGDPTIKKSDGSGGDSGFSDDGSEKRNNSDWCYNCRGLNHLARDCKQKPNDGRCYYCGDSSHLVRYCQKKGSSGGSNSWNINGNSSGDGKCYNCGEDGHYARDCAENKNNNAQCYKCWNLGHIARDCI